MGNDLSFYELLEDVKKEFGIIEPSVSLVIGYKPGYEEKEVHNNEEN